MTGKLAAGKINRISRAVILVLFGAFIAAAFLSTSAFDFNAPSILQNGMRAVLLAAVIVKYITGWISEGFKDKAKTLILLVIAILLAATRLFNSVGSFIDVGLLLLALNGEDFEKILKIFMIVLAALLVVSIIASCMHIIENYDSYHGAMARHAFGTRSATDFAAYFFFLEVSWIALRREKLKVIEFIAMAAAIAAIFVLCDARTSVILMSVTLLTAIGLKLRHNYLEKNGKEASLLPSWVLYIMAFSFIICGAFMILATYMYKDEGISALLNRVMTDRLSMGKLAMDDYGFSLFGKVIETTGVPGTADYFYLDSSYIFVLLRYGVTAFIAAWAIFQIPALKAAKNKDSWTVAALTLLSLSFIMEHHMMQVCNNPFIFLIAAAAPGREPAAICGEKKKTVPVVITLAIFVIAATAAVIGSRLPADYGTIDVVSPSTGGTGYVLNKNTVQEVLLQKDICGIDIELAGTQGLSDGLFFTMWERPDSVRTEDIVKDHRVTMMLKNEEINPNGYTRILTDYTFSAWYTHQFMIEPVNAEDVLMAYPAEKLNDFCRPLYTDGKENGNNVLSFRLVYRYNNIFMMVWIYILAMAAAFIVVIAGKSKRRTENK